MRAAHSRLSPALGCSLSGSQPLVWHPADTTFPRAGSRAQAAAPRITTSRLATSSAATGATTAATAVMRSAGAAGRSTAGTARPSGERGRTTERRRRLGGTMTAAAARRSAATIGGAMGAVARAPGTAAQPTDVRAQRPSPKWWSRSRAPTAPRARRRGRTPASAMGPLHRALVAGTDDGPLPRMAARRRRARSAMTALRQESALADSVKRRRGLGPNIDGSGPESLQRKTGSRLCRPCGRRPPSSRRRRSRAECLVQTSACSSKRRSTSHS